MKKKFLILLFFSLLFFACIKKDEYPPEPYVEYKEFYVLNNDSAIFTLKFTDGDGDIGLSSDDFPYPTGADGKYHYNLYMDYYFKDTDGIYKQYAEYISLPAPGYIDTTRFKYRTQRLESKAKNKSLNGEITVQLNRFRPLNAHKYFKYKFYIYDRSKNISNVVETPEFYYP